MQIIRNKIRKSVKEWDIEVIWKGRNNDWMTLEDLKKANPVEVAEHVSTRNIDKKVAFNWWVAYYLKKKEATMSQVASRISKNTHNHRI